MQNVDNNYLVDDLISNDVLKSSSLINAFKQIDRCDFVLEQNKNDCYVDSALEIGYGQTISQPQVVAFMLELLDLDCVKKVLDIGSGSAYTTALISKVLENKGYVFGLEKIPELVNFGKQNLQKYKMFNAFISRASYHVGVTNKKFDRILVSAAAKTLPNDLVDQLEDNGKMVIPIKDSIFLIEKKDGQVSEQEFKGYDFVPLVCE